MENKNNKPIEIFIKTGKEEKKNTRGRLQEGVTKTAGTLDMNHDVISGAVRAKLKQDEKEDEKTPVLENILEKTNKVVGTIVDTLSQNINKEQVSKLEIEFGIAFKENLKLVLFEAGAEQSIKFKVIVEKENKETSN